MKARIYRSSMRKFECVIRNQEGVKTQEVVATAKGNLLKDDSGLVVGDFVTLEQERTTGEWMITERQERRSEIFRIIQRENKRKVTAANVDLLVIVMSVSRPAFKRGILDRFLVRASQWEIPALVLFNKMDEYPISSADAEDSLDLVEEVSRLEGLEVSCFEYSATDPDYRPQFLTTGPKEFLSQLKGKTALFLGQSGVGKSATITSLAPAGTVLATQKVGKAGKGSHTTTWSEIIDVGNFFLIDSPGIRSFSLEDIDPEELILFFPDLREWAGHCQFYDCLHQENSKGCIFWEKFDPQGQEGKRVHSRLDSYRRLKDEVSQIPFWQKKL